MRRSHRVAVAVASAMGALGVMLSPAAARATPPSAVIAVTVFQMRYGGTDFILREITIWPGGTTGWHYHRGTLRVRVRSGTLTHVESDCSVHVYRAGQSFTEQSGAANVHLVRNLGPGPLVLDVLYVDPAGAALAEDVSAPACDRTGQGIRAAG